MRTRPKVPPARSQHPAPRWITLAGFITGVATLLFFMGLVVASVFGHVVPPAGRFPVSVVLAIGVAMSFAFIGGNAAAEGKIPLPHIAKRSLAFSVSGGVAVFLIVLAIGDYLIPAEETSAPVASSADTVVSGTVVFVAQNSKVIPYVSARPKNSVVRVLAEGETATPNKDGTFQLKIHKSAPAIVRFTVDLNGRPVCVTDETLGGPVTLPIKLQSLHRN